MSRNLLYFYGDRGFESVSLQQRVHVLREFAFSRRKAGLFRGRARRGRQKRHPTDTPTAFDLCHCSRCREASGSAFLAELEFKAAKFEWVCGQSLVRTYEAPVRKTPPGYRRTFCTDVARRCRQWIGASSVSLPGPLTAIPEFGHSATSSSTSKPLGSRSLTPLANLARNQNPVSREETRPAASGTKR